MPITPKVSETTPNTPSERIRAWLRGRRKRGGSGSTRAVVSWSHAGKKIELALFISPTTVFYPDSSHDTFAIHTEATSRVGAPLLSIEIGDPKSGEFDPYTMTINCLAGSDEFSGNSVIALAKDLARWMGANRIVLMDSSYVTCDTGEPYDLSFFMLLRYGLTWYMRQGFRPVVRGSHTRLQTLTEKLHKVTTDSVLRSCRAAITALDRVVDTKAFSHVEFEQPRLWKRGEKTEAHSSSFDIDRVRTVFSIRTHLLSAARGIERAVAAAGGGGRESFAKMMVQLQRKNCSAFFDIYMNLFDNDIYYWRVPISAYHFQVDKKEYRNEFITILQSLAALMGGDRAWMVCDDF